MKRGLIRKFSILIVSILLINNFSFIPSVSANTLGINEIDAKSELSFDLSEDKNNEKYTDETLQSEDKNNEKYTDETLQSEDKNNEKYTDESSQNDDNKQQITKDSYNDKFERFPDKIKISELKTKIQNVNNNSMENIPAFASESLWPLNRNIPFKGGKFSDDENFINYLSNNSPPRIFDKAYLIRQNSNDKIEISSYFTIKSNNSTEKYYIPAIQAGDEPTIAYKMDASDTVQANYKLTGNIRKYTIDNRSANNVKSEIVPGVQNVDEGSTVIINIKYQGNVSDVVPEVTSSNGATIPTQETSKNVENKEKKYIFTMPSSNVTINYRTTIIREKRKVALQTDTNVYYQGEDTGYISLFMPHHFNNNNSVYMGQNNFFSQNYVFGMENSRGGGALNETAPNRYQGVGVAWNGNMEYRNKDNIGNLNIKDNMIDGSVYTGIEANTDQNNRPYASAYFNPETTNKLKFNLSLSRAKWNGRTSLNYRYQPSKLITVKVFNRPDFNQSDFTDKAYTEYSVPLFQDKQGWDRQYKDNKEIANNKDLDIEEAQDIWNGKIIAENTLEAENGMYPVATVLPNGMRIVCYQNYYNYRKDQSPNPGKIDPGIYNNNDYNARRYSFTIKVENVSESFLLNASYTPVTQQFYQISTNDNAFIDNNNNTLQFYNSKDTTKYGEAKDANVIIQNDRITDFKMKVKNGYSYPYVYITDFNNRPLPYSINLNTIAKPDVNKGEGRWWIEFKDNNSKKLKNNTLGIKQGSSGNSYTNESSTDGYFHIRFNPQLTGNLSRHTSYPLVIKSEPIQFTYIFNDTNITGNNINVEDNRFFNVPSDIPPSQDVSKKYFKGWKLTCKIFNPNDTNDATGKIIEFDNNGKLYMPRDLIDISTIAERLSNEFTINDIGKTSYKLNFEPQYSSSLSEAKYIDSTWKRYIQNNYNDDPTTQNNPIQGNFGTKKVVKDEKLILSYSTIYQNNFYLGYNSQVVDRITASNQDFAKLYYYKGLKVLYSFGANNSGTLPIDNNLYITKNITKNANLPDNLTPLTNTITLKSATASNNKNVTGWKLLNGNTNKVYSVNDVIDLSKSSSDTSGNTKSIPDAARQDIFNTGQIKLEAVYDTPIKIVHADGSNGSTKKFNQVGFHGQDVIIQAKFKFVDMNGNQTNYKFDQVINKIKFVLLKKGRGGTTYNIWNNENGSVHPFGTVDEGGQRVPKIDITYKYDPNDTSGNFTINMRLKSKYLGSTWDHTADFRIVPFTENNMGMKGIDSNQLGNILQNGDPDFTRYQVPIVSTMLYFGTPTEIIQYPKKVVMFDKPDGNLDSGKNQIKLLPYSTDPNITHILPNANSTFTVSIADKHRENNTYKVDMNNAIANDSFKALLVNPDNPTVNLTNPILGILQYNLDQHTNKVLGNSLYFRLYYNNTSNKKFNDGVKYSGTLTFVFQQNSQNTLDEITQ